jgi:hypothetical protein
MGEGRHRCVVSGTGAGRQALRGGHHGRHANRGSTPHAPLPPLQPAPARTTTPTTPSSASRSPVPASGNGPLSRVRFSRFHKTKQALSLILVARGGARGAGRKSGVERGALDGGGHAFLYL